MEKIVFLLMFSLVLFCNSKGFAYDDHDFQFWNTEIEEIRLNKTSKLVFEEEFRLADNASNFYYQHYDALYVYELGKQINVGIGYRYIKELVNKSFRVENEPYLYATLSCQLKGFKLDSRSRLEYRTYNYKKVDSWRYRNKFTVKFPWKFTKLEIQPYIADEIFIRFNGTDLNQNRLFGGLGFTLTKNLKAEIYYMLQYTKNYKSTESNWTDINVLGTKLKLAF